MQLKLLGLMEYKRESPCCKPRTLSSQQNTRNATNSNKKHIYCTPTAKNKTNMFYTTNCKSSVHKSEHKPQLSPSEQTQMILRLQQKKNQLMQASQYASAEIINNKLKKMYPQLIISKCKQNSQKYLSQQQHITNQYKLSINKLNKLWKQYFKGLQKQEHKALVCFKNQQCQDIEKARQKLIKRCEKLRPKSEKQIFLSQTQCKLQKLQNFHELISLQREKDQLKTEISEVRDHTIDRWVKAEQSKLKTQYSKKYQVLLMRMQDNYNDKQQMYHKQKQKLNRKFINTNNKIQHYQKIQQQQIIQNQSVYAIHHK